MCFEVKALGLFEQVESISVRVSNWRRSWGSKVDGVSVSAGQLSSRVGFEARLYPVVNGTEEEG